MKKIVGIFVCTLLITTILPFLKFTEPTQAGIINVENNKELNRDCFLCDDVINYDNEYNFLSDINVNDHHINYDDLKYSDYTLWDPVDVRIKYTDTVKNNGIRGITVQTRYAVPPEAPTLLNQVVLGEVIFTPDLFSTALDNWSQMIAFYERAIPGGETSITYYEVNATIYNITFDIDPENVFGPIPDVILNKYTADATMYNLTNQTLQDAVQEAIGSETNLYWKAKLLHDYVKDHLYYHMDGKWDEAPVVLLQGHGSCTEYTWLYIALCRIAGIPARYVGGTVMTTTGVTPHNDTVFHRWSQIYLPNYGWIPVDVTWDDSTSSDNYFGATSNRVFVTTISGGPSNYLGWSYNCVDTCDPKPCNVTIERVATWLEYKKVSPYTPQPPDGPLTGTVRINYEYTTSTIEPDGDPIWFWFDWGDNTASGWRGPYRSGEKCTVSHSWKKQGNYQIKVKAKDKWDYESGWSESIKVNIPRYRLKIDSSFLRYIDMFSVLQRMLELIK